MSTCDCDRKDSNGGTCDNSCTEEFFMNVELNNSRPVSFAPAAAHGHGAVEIVSLEGYCADQT